MRQGKLVQADTLASAEGAKHCCKSIESRGVGENVLTTMHTVTLCHWSLCEM